MVSVSPARDGTSAATQIPSRTRRTPVVCPKCGEVNSSNFLFCGMCGTILDPVRRATPAAPPLSPPPPRAVERQPALNNPVTPPPPAPPVKPPVAPTPVASAPVPSIGGPSLLGLDQANPSPNVDAFRDQAFAGLASYGRPQEQRSAGRVLLMIALIAALAGAGWWTYKNYIAVADSGKTVATAPVREAISTPPQDPASKQSEKNAVEKDDAKATPAPAADAPPENTNAAPAITPPVENPAPVAAKQSAKPEGEKIQKPIAPAPLPARHEVSATRLPAPQATPATDSGDALFRRGEAYLYGRHGTEDCANALKFLKMASDKQHAKARSMMGTMYATGHCVSHDLPSSYRWFALALRVDPNNVILEKDLSAVWNQMTPPERQLATKSY